MAFRKEKWGAYTKSKLIGFSKIEKKGRLVRSNRLHGGKETTFDKGTGSKGSGKII